MVIQGYKILLCRDRVSSCTRVQEMVAVGYKGWSYRDTKDVGVTSWRGG